MISVQLTPFTTMTTTDAVMEEEHRVQSALTGASPVLSYAFIRWQSGRSEISEMEDNERDGEEIN